MTTYTENSIYRIETEYGLFAEGDGIYLYKKDYKAAPALL